MKFNKQFKTFDLADMSKDVLVHDIPMLLFLENDGDQGILHFVVWPDNLGTVDLKLSGPFEMMEQGFHKTDQEGAQTVFDENIKPMLDAVLMGDGDDDAG